MKVNFHLCECIYIYKRWQEKSLNNCEPFECTLGMLKRVVISAVGLSLL